MTKEELATKWVNDLVDNGFKRGWFGDDSEQFRKEETAVILATMEGSCSIQHYQLINTLVSDCGNLKQYCKWTEVELEELLKCFRITDMRELMSLYFRPVRETKELFKGNRYCREMDTKALSKK